MPIYEYECEKCGKRFERLVWSSDKTEPRCECGGEARKVFSVSSCSTGGSSSLGCDTGSCSAGGAGYESGTCPAGSAGFS
jgi:putative FmdB family regulatory protein